MAREFPYSSLETFILFQFTYADGFTYRKLYGHFIIVTKTRTTITRVIFLGRLCVNIEREIIGVQNATFEVFVYGLSAELRK